MDDPKLERLCLDAYTLMLAISGYGERGLELLEEMHLAATEVRAIEDWPAPHAVH